MKTHIELEKMLGSQVDRKHIINRKKRIQADKENKKKIYNIQNNIHKKQQSIPFLKKPKLIVFQPKKSIPISGKMKDKYKELLDAINSQMNEDESYTGKIPTLYANWKSYNTICTSLEGSMMRFRNYAKEPLFKMGTKITIEQLNKALEKKFKASVALKSMPNIKGDETECDNITKSKSAKKTKQLSLTLVTDLKLPIINVTSTKQ